MVLSSICITLLIVLCVRTNAEIFTSVEDLESLLETQKRLIQELDKYKQDDYKYSFLERHLNVFRREHEKAMEDIHKYIENPINAYTLIKRMTNDVKHLENTKIGAEYINEVKKKYENMTFSTSEDLNGAAVGLVRLQKVYKLNVNDLAEGRLGGTYCSPMTASDCYEIGHVIYKEEDYVNAHAWMIQAFRKYHDEQVVYPFSDLHILEYMNLSGDKYTKNITEVLRQEMNATRGLSFTSVLNSVSYIRDAFPYSLSPKKYCISMMIFTARMLYAKVLRSSPPVTGNRKAEDIVGELCRGDMELPIEIYSRLTCRYYMSEEYSFMKIAPFKIEMLHLDPDVMLFHNVVSDDEIEIIKQVAKPRMKRSVVLNRNVTETTAARVSKSVLLLTTESIMAKLSRRVAHMTGLNMETADNFSVINYGIGGHYLPHYDFSLKDQRILLRIATLLIYLTDVTQGGATIFPIFGLTVFPVKGTAILWTNMFPSGMGNLATLHSACPVVLGSKWVMTRWINQPGQEFIRPCNLEFQDQSYGREYPNPVPKAVLKYIQTSKETLSEKPNT